MKTIISIILSILLSSSLGISQKVAYIELDKILSEIPEFAQSQEEIKNKTNQWKSEIDAKYKEIETVYKKYTQEESSLTDEQKRLKQEEIFNLEKEAKELKKQKFGSNGELKKLEEEKLNPIRDNALKVAQEVSKENGYDFVFDRSAGGAWVYTNPNYNITDLVLKKLGVSN